MPKSRLMEEIAQLDAEQQAEGIALTGQAEEQNELSELSIFPALGAYKEKHTEISLRKLCVQIGDFCSAVYASTRSDSEREIYRSMIAKLLR